MNGNWKGFRDDGIEFDSWMAFGVWRDCGRGRGGDVFREGRIYGWVWELAEADGEVGAHCVYGDGGGEYWVCADGKRVRVGRDELGVGGECVISDRWCGDACGLFVVGMEEVVATCFLCACGCGERGMCCDADFVNSSSIHDGEWVV